MIPVVFLDTNIVLDALSNRDPFHLSAGKLFSEADSGNIHVICTALSFANACYFLKKIDGYDIAMDKLRKFKTICGIAITTEISVEKALTSDFTDFEDALQYYSALESKADVIITRDNKGFKEAALPVFTADEYLKLRTSGN